MHKIAYSDLPSTAFCVRYSPSGEFLAVGLENGAVQLYSIDTGRLLYTLPAAHEDALSITGLRFRPEASHTSDALKNVLLITDANGQIRHWHFTSGRVLSVQEEPGNQIYSCDISPTGDTWATAGKDRLVRVYDAEKKTCVSSMGAADILASSVVHGHTNRVFSVKYHPGAPHTLVSAGWDNTVQIWDTRAGHSVKSIYGPHLAGDALDVTPAGKIVTGSWRTLKALQVWDLGSGTCEQEDVWNAGAGTPAACTLYAARWQQSGTRSIIAAGGSGSNEVRLFDASAGFKRAGRPIILPGPVFGLDMHGAQHMAVAGNFRSVYTYSIEQGSESESKQAERDDMELEVSAPAADAAAAPVSPLHREAVTASNIESAIRDMSLASGDSKSDDDDADADDDEDAPGFGTNSGVVGGSGFAAARARRATTPR